MKGRALLRVGAVHLRWGLARGMVRGSGSGTRHRLEGAGHEQGRVASVIALARKRACRQCCHLRIEDEEELAAIVIALVCRPVKGTAAVDVLLVDGDVVLCSKSIKELRLAVLSRDVRHSVAFAVPGQGICPRLDKNVQGGHCPRHRGPVQRSLFCLRYKSRSTPFTM